MKIKLDEQYVVDGNRYGIRLMKMTYDKKKGKDTPQNTFYFNTYGQAVAQGALVLVKQILENGLEEKS